MFVVDNQKGPYACRLKTTGKYKAQHLISLVQGCYLLKTIKTDLISIPGILDSRIPMTIVKSANASLKTPSSGQFLVTQSAASLDKAACKFQTVHTNSSPQTTFGIEVLTEPHFQILSKLLVP